MEVFVRSPYRVELGDSGAQSVRFLNVLKYDILVVIRAVIDLILGYPLLFK